MSKQEKLAALMEAVETYCLKCTGKNAWGVEIKTAYDDWRNTPDDPPQPPEMPECVRKLLAWFAENPVSAMPVQTKLESVRDHYRKPIKLEVGKCYEDAEGSVIDIVWQDPKNPNHFIGISRLEGVPWWYVKDGTAKSDHLRYAGAKLIREVPNG